MRGYGIEVSKVYMVPKVYYEGVWDRSFQSLYGSKGIMRSME